MDVSRPLDDDPYQVTLHIPEASPWPGCFAVSGSRKLWPDGRLASSRGDCLQVAATLLTDDLRGRSFVDSPKASALWYFSRDREAVANCDSHVLAVAKR